MKWRAIICLLLFAGILITPITTARSADSPWESLAPGIDYQHFILPDPNNVYVARMDRKNANVTLESSIAQGKTVGGLETVRGMAGRYDQAINYWDQTWGSRNRVVVAINGSYLDNTEVSQGQVYSGWYAKRFANFQTGTGGSGFAWLLDRRAFVGQCVFHNAEKQLVHFLGLAGATQRFHGINVARGTNQLILYTPQYDRTTNTPTPEDGSAVEVLVDMSQPSLLIPTPSWVKGVVREIREGKGSTPIPFDHIVLSAHGTAKDALLANLAGNGGEIGISQEISNCPGFPSVDWTRTYASVGGDYPFLIQGEIKPFSTPRHPRTAIAFNNDYIYFIVVDGRDPGISRGMTINELALFSRDVLGATDGTAQDGGGSSTMVVNGKIMNKPNGNIQCHHNFLPLLIKAGAEQSSNQVTEGEEGLIYLPQQAPSLGPEEVSEAQDLLFNCERYVPNGMMMIVVEPAEKSTFYTPGDAVKTSAAANLRLGPGTNFGILATLPPNLPGTIEAHSKQTEGVLAKGYYWWKVEFQSTSGNLTGWIVQDLIAPASSP